MGLVRDQLTLAFGGTLPATVCDLLAHDDVLDAHALGFVAGPILPLGAGSVRAFVANPGQPAFADRLRSVFGAAVNPLLAQAPAEGRLMVESTGSSHRLFADDLHQHAGADPSVIARSLTLPQGTWGVLSRSPIEAAWEPVRERAIQTGIDGLWLAHRTDGAIDHLLVVNEARWSTTPEPQALALDALAAPAWMAQRALAARHGLAAYPDAIEVHPLGWAVTVGLYDPAAPARRR